MSFLFGGGSKQQAPASVQTVSQTSEFPTEVQPFITDVLEKAKAQQEGREFELFEGPRIAPFTTEEETAFTGIEGLAQAGLGSFPDMASSAFYAQQAQDAAEQGLRQMEAADVARLTNPFQQNVIDLEKEEAIRQFEGTTLPQIGAQAAGTGGFGGSRQAILEAEAQRNLQQQLGDIQSRGLRDAYDLAARQFEAERARQAQGAGQFAGFAQTFPGQAMRELGALQSVGEQRKAVDQRALDIALSDFLTEQEFPSRQLQEYQSLIRGFPIQPNIFRQEVQSLPAVPLSQQLLGLGAAGAGVAGQLGAFRKSGGQIEGGLSSLEKHQDNIPRPQFRPQILGDISVEDIMFQIRGGEFPSKIIEEADRYLETIPGYEGGKNRTSASRASAIRDMIKKGQLDPTQRIARGRVNIPEALRPPVVDVDETVVKETTDNTVVEASDTITERMKDRINLLKEASGGGGNIISNPFLSPDFADLEEIKERFTRPGPAREKYRSEIESFYAQDKIDERKDKAKQDYTDSLFRALASGGLELASKRDPGAGGMIGQIASAAKRAGVVDTIGEAGKELTKTQKDLQKEQLGAYKVLAELESEDLDRFVARAGLTADFVNANANLLEAMKEDPEKMKVVGTMIHNMRSTEGDLVNSQFFDEGLKPILANVPSLRTNQIAELLNGLLADARRSSDASKKSQPKVTEDDNKKKTEKVFTNAEDLLRVD